MTAYIFLYKFPLVKPGESINIIALPSVEFFFGGSHWLGVAGLFLLFRAFDVLKPWPVRQSQRLPGGWGVTVDDFLAAIYVALISLPFLR